MASQEPLPNIDREQLARDMTQALEDLTNYLTQRATQPDPSEIGSRPMYPGDPMPAKDYTQPDNSHPPDAPKDLTDTLADDRLGSIIKGTGREIRSHRRPEQPGRWRRITALAAGLGSIAVGVYAIWKGFEYFS